MRRSYAFRAMLGLGAAAIIGALQICACAPVSASSEAPSPESLFARAANESAVGIARKTKLVDARPAIPGEVIVTVIAGEGKETQSKPAKTGDMVVRNRCPDTGNEEYLVAAGKFPGRYGEPLGSTDQDGWRPYRPAGQDMHYVVVRPEDGTFSFTAPWGEAMVAKPGDAIVRDPNDPKDTYRVAAASFDCSYEIVKPAEPKR